MSECDEKKTDGSFLAIAAQVFVLSALVISKPLYDIMASHPEYFIVNRISNGEIYFFVLTFAVLIPACICGPLALARFINHQLSHYAAACLVFLFGGVFALQLLRRIELLPGSVCVAIALIASVYIGIQYWRQTPFSRNLATALLFLIPITVIFPLLFVFDKDLQRVLRPEIFLTQEDIETGTVRVDKKSPIVMVVFDEFSSIDLLDAGGNIDTKRFPNFADFATDSTWYTNASAVSWSTLPAVSSILTGNYPESGKLARVHDHPRNLFSMLRNHYSLNVVEPVTLLSVDPAAKAGRRKETIESRMARMRTFAEDLAVLYLQFTMPESYQSALPNTKTKWGGFLVNQRPPVSAENGHQHEERSLKTRPKRSTHIDRKLLFEQFVASIADFPASTLHFIHIGLPHAPYIYLPSGRIHNSEKIEGVRGVRKSGEWIHTGHPIPLRRKHQNYQLQIGFVDKLLGTLMGELKRLELYDEAMVIVCADHGKSFQLDIHSRAVSAENFGDVALVPLLIKYPGHSAGQRNDTNVETIDILPTIRDVIGAEVHWDFDGRSLMTQDVPDRDVKRIDNAPTVEPAHFTMSPGEYLSARDDAIARNSRTFSLNDPRSDLFHFGIGLDVIGVSASSVKHRRVSASISCEGLDALKEINLEANYLPTSLTGKVDDCDGDPENLALLVSVNGAIEHATKLYRYRGDWIFDLMLSDSVFRQGKNDIEVFLVDSAIP